MPYITEPTMQEALRSWLESRGYEVNSEVPLDDYGIIDLAAYDPERDVFIGIELKDASGQVAETIEKESSLLSRDLSKEVENPTRKWYTRPWRQLAKYQASGFFDEIYFASQAPEVGLNNKDKPIVQSIYEEYDGQPEWVGGMKIKDPLDSDSISITTEATTIPRDRSITFRYTTETWVQHYVWKEVGGIREAVIPNKSTRTEQRIDIMSFSGSSDPTDVYVSQPEERIIGIEVKGEESVQANPSSIEDQLSGYFESGALTDLYLAVPASVKSQALDIIDTSGLDKVGLYTVSADEAVSEVKESSFTPLRYDGLRLESGSTIDIGWGRYHGKEESSVNYSSVFDFVIETL